MKILRGCAASTLLIIGVGLLLCSVLAGMTTPVSVWLYQHNFYFQRVVDALHG